MADREFMENVLLNDIKANVYTRDIDDVYDFMERTESGFWSWTMMYHFSPKDIKVMHTKQDVIREAKEIVERVEVLNETYESTAITTFHPRRTQNSRSFSE